MWIQNIPWTQIQDSRLRATKILWVGRKTRWICSTLRWVWMREINRFKTIQQRHQTPSRSTIRSLGRTSIQEILRMTLKIYHLKRNWSLMCLFQICRMTSMTRLMVLFWAVKVSIREYLTYRTQMDLRHLYRSKIHTYNHQINPLIIPIKIKININSTFKMDL